MPLPTIKEVKAAFPNVAARDPTEHSIWNAFGIFEFKDSMGWLGKLALGSVLIGTALIIIDKNILYRPPPQPF